MANHIIDPTYFYDCIEEFSFNYNLYVVTGKTTDEYGKRHDQYTLYNIRGSLQSEGTKLNRSKEGNTYEQNYEFYCKSLYRINIGDILSYKNNFYLVDALHDDYEEYGVRGAHLVGIKLTAYRDLSDYIDYLNGEKFI